jgi:hypothetical protein
MSDFKTNGLAQALKPYMGSVPATKVTTAKRRLLPDWGTKPAGVFANLPRNSLKDGLEADMEEVRSAALAIPPSAISTEPEWMKFARAFAYEAALFPNRAEQLWEILDSVSRRAPGYDEADNRIRFQRYIDEAFDREHPTTIHTLFNMALGACPSNRKSSSRGE